MKEDPDSWINDPEHPWLENTELLERWASVAGKTIAVDFDGVLHPYTKGWVGSVPDNEVPIEGAEMFLKTLGALGYRIVVFSTRANHQEGYDGIWSWLIGYRLDEYIAEVTDKKPAALAYVDDRAVPFHGSWDSVLLDIKILSTGGMMKPHVREKKD